MKNTFSAFYLKDITSSRAVDKAYRRAVAALGLDSPQKQIILFLSVAQTMQQPIKLRGIEAREGTEHAFEVELRDEDPIKDDATVMFAGTTSVSERNIEVQVHVPHLATERITFRLLVPYP